MIDDKTIKSLYDDKPTLLEWLKRVEAQLEELKKATNFDKLTANNAEVKEDVNANNLEAKNSVVTNTLTAEDATIKGRLDGHNAYFDGVSTFDSDVNLNADVGVYGQFTIGDSNVSKAIYVHKISWQYVSASPNVYLYYLSVNPVAYASMADIFAHKNDTNLSYSELAEFMGDSAIIRFTGNGAILSCVQITGTGGQAAMTAISASSLVFTKDEVVGSWYA